ncbi:hypothetical protein [Nocardioides sp.]|jgi:hypothetical protein|uniref:hypothetical protein n=1 Tax=Nocardioides sp. TaxID=35761 RepID=UPI0031FF3B71|nr:laminin sub domain 2 [Nocardioides sp.]
MTTPAQRRGGLLAVAVVVLVLGATGTSFAFWSGPPGSGGSGQANTGSTQSLILTPATPTADLHPGGQTDVRLSVTNPNAAGMHVASLFLDTTEGSGGLAVDAGHPGCDLSALSFATQTNGGSGWAVAGNGSASLTLTNALSMSLGAANACQGARFTVYLTAGP